jgi:hypothetical protein
VTYCTVLRDAAGECKKLWGASSNGHFRVDKLLRELANPNLHDIPTNLPSASKCGIDMTSTSAG